MGLFWLTGSESIKLLKGEQDSLAGRICILKMYSLSQREKAGKSDLGEMEFSYNSLLQRSSEFPKNDLPEVYKHIWEAADAEVLRDLQLILHLTFCFLPLTSNVRTEPSIYCMITSSKRKEAGA